MLNDQQILADLHALPAEKQLKVLKLIERLKDKGPEGVNEPSHQSPLRPFGVIKGKSWLAEDFNQPLDDFQEYMT